MQEKSEIHIIALKPRKTNVQLRMFFFYLLPPREKNASGEARVEGEPTAMSNLKLELKLEFQITTFDWFVFPPCPHAVLVRSSAKRQPHHHPHSHPPLNLTHTPGVVSLRNSRLAITVLSLTIFLYRLFFYSIFEIMIIGYSSWIRTWRSITPWSNFLTYKHYCL